MHELVDTIKVCWSTLHPWGTRPEDVDLPLEVVHLTMNWNINTWTFWQPLNLTKMAGNVFVKVWWI